MENPFKFGTIVEEEYFTDRVEEVAYIREFLKSGIDSIYNLRFTIYYLFWNLVI